VDNGKVVSLIEDKAELDVIELKKYIELVTKEVKQEQKKDKKFSSTAMPLRHERETLPGPIELNVGQIRVLVDANIIVKTNRS
jgi:hypothetical protein